MSAPPALTELADTYPLPSNATFKGGITKLLNYALGLLGTTGNAADARVALGIGPAISFRQLLDNATGAINQRVYVSGTNTTTANQVTLDRWRVVTSGQNITFAAAAPDRTITCPAGGLEQVIEAGRIVGGVYTLAWGGTATATVNGAAIVSGAQTAALPANTAVTVRFSGGTLSLPQFEFGTVATPFERRTLGFELQQCQRHFWKTFPPATAPAQNVGSYIGAITLYNTGTQGFRFSVPYPVEMASIPALVTYCPNLANAGWVGTTGGATASVLTFISTGTRQTDIGASGTAAGGDTYAIHMTAATGF